jgi:hypothetical protein
MTFVPTGGITHGETAWLVNAVPLFGTIAVVLLLTLLLGGRLLLLSQQLLARRTARGRSETVDAALLWVPPIVSPVQLLGSCTIAGLLVLCVFYLVGPLFVALVLAGPATALLIAGLLWMHEAHYRAQLDAALPAAVQRLAAQLAAGDGFQGALEQVALDLPPGPLRTEWLWVLDRLGTPLGGGKLATGSHVVGALAAQTPSQRHRALLGHWEDVLLKRMVAAGEALHAAARRRSAAATELAQMKYSGIAVGLAGVVMAVYLALTQPSRMAVAYGGDLGLLVGALVLGALLAPLIGGVLLARVEDLDY